MSAEQAQQAKQRASITSTSQVLRKITITIPKEDLADALGESASLTGWTPKISVEDGNLVLQLEHTAPNTEADLTYLKFTPEKPDQRNTDYSYVDGGPL